LSLGKRRFDLIRLALAACGNTMRSHKIALADLLPGFATAEKGGVVRVAELQSQGYLYLRPREPLNYAKPATSRGATTPSPFAGERPGYRAAW
jgi:hypothetical protein